MVIQKYSAELLNGKIAVGYIVEQREYLGRGSYSDKTQYCICVTEISMPNSVIRGCFIVKPKTIKPF